MEQPRGWNILDVPFLLGGLSGSSVGRDLSRRVCMSHSQAAGSIPPYGSRDAPLTSPPGHHRSSNRFRTSALFLLPKAMQLQRATSTCIRRD